jgi:hypothetical protein
MKLQREHILLSRLTMRVGVVVKAVVVVRVVGVDYPG